MFAHHRNASFASSLLHHFTITIIMTIILLFSYSLFSDLQKMYSKSNFQDANAIGIYEPVHTCTFDCDLRNLCIVSNFKFIKYQDNFMMIYGTTSADTGICNYRFSIHLEISCVLPVKECKCVDHCLLKSILNPRATTSLCAMPCVIIHVFVFMHHAPWTARNLYP
jgi:hypothetical protein